MMRGFDVDQDVGHLAAQIKAAGYDFVGRYLKNLTVGEMRALSAAGISIVSIWERSGGRDSLNRGQGVVDGTNARAWALDLGQPKGSAIYSAIDYDAPVADWPEIADYFGAFNNALARDYECGAYGNGLMLGRLLDTGIIDRAYLAGASGWYGSAGFTKWDIRQHPTITDQTLGIEIDPCEAVDDDFGAWMLALEPSQMPTVPSALELQKALNAAGATLVEDNVWGPRSAAALAAYYRDHG